MDNLEESYLHSCVTISRCSVMFLGLLKNHLTLPFFCSISRSLKSQIIHMFKLKDEQLQALEVTAFRIVVGGLGLRVMTNMRIKK